MSSSEVLFGDPDFLEKLAYFDLVAKQIIAGSRRGERRTKKRGAGTLFQDYRSYVRGDDLRYVDWNIYSRLGSLFADAPVTLAGARPAEDLRQGLLELAWKMIGRLAQEVGQPALL